MSQSACMRRRRSGGGRRAEAGTPGAARRWGTRENPAAAGASGGDIDRNARGRRVAGRREHRSAPRGNGAHKAADAVLLPRACAAGDSRRAATWRERDGAGGARLPPPVGRPRRRGLESGGSARKPHAPRRLTAAAEETGGTTAVSLSRPAPEREGDCGLQGTGYRGQPATTNCGERGTGYGGQPATAVGMIPSAGSPSARHRGYKRREPRRTNPAGLRGVQARLATATSPLAQYAVNSRRLGEPVPALVTLLSVAPAVSALLTVAGEAVPLLCR
jgi:hypothetical protein